MEDKGLEKEVGQANVSYGVWDTQSPGLILTERDFEIFGFIHEERYVTESQIRMAFWPGTSKTADACGRRMQKFAEESYLNKVFCEKFKTYLYSLTEKSFEILKGRGLDQGLERYVPREGFEANLDHNLKVTTLRLLFGGLGFKDWTSERTLRAKNVLAHIPDGVLKVNGQSIAIEFENYLTKEKCRYEEMLEYYKTSPSYYLVFVMVEGNLKEWLMEMNYRTDQVWFVRHLDFRKNPKSARFENKAAHFTLEGIMG